MRRDASIAMVLYTKMDAQCVKLVTVVGLIFDNSSTVDEQLWNFS